MPTFMPETQDQALLVLVVDEAQRIIKKHKGKGYLGRTALQKILYFLKVKGVSMNYRFDLHHHGPFCADILNDADILKALDIISDNGKQGRYSDYRIGEMASQLMGKHNKFLEDNRSKVTEVVQAMVPLEPVKLELIATLDFAFRWIKATGVRGPWKGKVIEKFFEIKKEKMDQFPRNEVEAAYDNLVEAGLIEA